MNKLTLVAALLAGSMLSTPVLAATIEGNVGATTDYIWRGNTQAGGDVSFSGGVDIDFGNGFAAGVWTGSLGGDADDEGEADYELDLYASYGFALNGVDLEVGYISYQYPGVADSAADFADIYVSAGVGPFSVSYFMLESAENEVLEDSDATYVSVDAEFGLSDGWTLGLHYGEENFDGEDYDDNEDTAISLSKEAVTFTISGNEGDDTRAIVSWGASF
ncbi:TorF family putative porin [Alphaproteobacteria bacterium]|nr:TorF family putative porin [Alphaproteobacteria bacterium]